VRSSLLRTNNVRILKMSLRMYVLDEENSVKLEQSKPIGKSKTWTNQNQIVWLEKNAHC
jgi:hypothetical protein